MSEKRYCVSLVNIFYILCGVEVLVFGEKKVWFWVPQIQAWAGDYKGLKIYSVKKENNPAQTHEHSEALGQCCLWNEYNYDF